MRNSFWTAATVCAVALLASVHSPRADYEPVAAAAPFPSLPLPPEVGPLVGLGHVYPKGRSVHLGLVRREAERQGLPADIADAVVHIESSYNPNAVGGVGEVGLMQIRPQTASMLGYKGTDTGLFEPETNIRYSVAYLTGAWRRADGDLCRALMKYRAGHGEERMSALSVEYCRRARGYLAAIGSPLGDGAVPTVARPAGPFGSTRLAPPAQTFSAMPAKLALSSPLPGGGLRLVAPAQTRSSTPAKLALSSALPPRRPGPERIRVASAGAVTLSSGQISGIAARHAFERARKLRTAQLWAVHEERLNQ